MIKWALDTAVELSARVEAIRLDTTSYAAREILDGFGAHLVNLIAELSLGLVLTEAKPSGTKST